VAEKKFVGKDIYYIAVFKKNDARTIYNVVYRDGKDGWYYIKRFAVTGTIRDREYDLTKGKPDSRISYFSANPNGEAEVIKITHKPNPRLRKITFEADFSDIAIKGRQAMGNILTKYPIHRIMLKHQGGSTLGGLKVWFDYDVLRLNYDHHGDYLGEFQNDDLILVILNNGEYYTTNFDVNNHYKSGIRAIEKFDAQKVWTAVLYDASQKGYPYLKRFCFEPTSKKQSYLGDNAGNQLILLTDEVYPRLEVVFGGGDAFREPMIVEADEFIAVKGYKAKGKRLTTFAIETINELEPTKQVAEDATPAMVTEEPAEENLDPDKDKSDGDILDELTGQGRLF
jgi:topoisomerase-4 subunit A